MVEREVSFGAGEFGDGVNGAEEFVRLAARDAGFGGLRKGGGAKSEQEDEDGRPGSQAG